MSFVLFDVAPSPKRSEMSDAAALSVVGVCRLLVTDLLDSYTGETPVTDSQCLMEGRQEPLH